MPKRSVLKNSVQDKNSGKKNICKVLFVSSEAFPFFGTGGLGDYSNELPRALNLSGDCEVRVILPLYECFPQERRKELEFVCWTFVKLAWRNQYCGLFRLKEGNNVFYFIDNEYYFKRKNLYGYPDDGERFAYFSKAVLDILPRLEFSPDIIHCNDWQTALVPIYRKLLYAYSEKLKDIKCLFTIHNISYQGWYDKNSASDIFGIPENEIESLEMFGEINLVKGAINCADVVSTVSPTYASEISSGDCISGIDIDIRKNSAKLYGILNGINESANDPDNDVFLMAHFSSNDISAKRLNKAELQKSMWLPVKNKVPLIGILCSSTTEDDINFIHTLVPALTERDVQSVFIVFGEEINDIYLKQCQEEYDDKLRVTVLSEITVGKVCAGLDMLVIPQRYAPCGTIQMIACRYGAIPIVKASGGLNDAITDYDGKGGIGFKFEKSDAASIINKLDKATEIFLNDPVEWSDIVKRAMKKDFSWSKCAKEYVRLYIGSL